MQNSIAKRTLVCRTWKSKTVASVIAVVSAVALPQLFHLVGAVSEMGSALGETYLPMHLAIFMVGLLAGWQAGLVSGLFAPLASYAFTAVALGSPMPALPMLPYMMSELAAYGVACGLLARVQMPVFCKVLIAQIFGRAVRAVAVCLGYYLLSSPIAPSVIWTSIIVGLPGILLQWVLVPLFTFYIEKKSEEGKR